MTDRARDHRAAPAPDPAQLLTVADVAAHIGAHESTVRGWIKLGELKAHKFGARIGWRIKRVDDEDVLARRTLTGVIARQLLQHEYVSWRPMHSRFSPPRTVSTGMKTPRRSASSA